ncbi:MAG TPA: GMC family oxidoreductase [Pseudomonadota bacterium]|nr:GMC family oxidoreductase [Pseudomonadota bacterium]
MSDTIIGNKALDRFDALIIGSGPAGSAVASILCQHGRKVLILEAGPNYFEGLDDPRADRPLNHFSGDEIKSGRGLVDPMLPICPRSYRRSEADGERLGVGTYEVLPQTVGGGSTFSDLKFPRFTEADFQLGTRLPAIPDANFADWPISYAELEPFYTYVEYTAGVQGLDGSDPNQPPRSRPYPMPPGVPQYGGLLIAEGARKLGYTLFPAPTCINSRPYRGRPACRDCGMCGGFGCPINAKGSSAVGALRTALLSGSCQLHSQTRVLRLVQKSGQSELAGVEAVLPDGSRRLFTADRYILACNAIEDARMVLVSAPGGLGNSSDLVGRNLTLHAKLVAFGIFNERVHCHRSRSSTFFMTDFRGVAGDPLRPLGGIVETSGNGTPIGEAIQYWSQLRVPVGPRLKAMMRQGVGRDRGLAMSLVHEDAPQLKNRVDLDPQLRDIYGTPGARLTYAPHPFEQAAAAVYGPKLLDIMMAAGAKYAALLPGGELPATLHLHGTLRFGKDPKTSVCRPDGRFHDIGNLYACGGALFPTASGHSPTLTIASLATRIAAEMISPGSPERALPAF